MNAIAIVKGGDSARVYAGLDVRAMGMGMGIGMGIGMVYAGLDVRACRGVGWTRTSGGACDHRDGRSTLGEPLG